MCSELLVGRGMVTKLVDFYLGDLSPIRSYGSSKRQSMGNVRGSTFEICLFAIHVEEVLTTMCANVCHHKLDYVCGNMCGNVCGSMCGSVCGSACGSVWAVCVWLCGSVCMAVCVRACV
jgi:hypothetical protein